MNQLSRTIDKSVSAVRTGIEHPGKPAGKAKDFLGRLWAKMSEENIGLMAAGIAFYCFLSIAPLLAAVILSYGLIADPNTVAKNIQSIMSVVPPDAAKLIIDQLLAVVTASSGKTGFGLVIALFFALYGATRASNAVMQAMNVINLQREDRSIVRSTATSFAIIIGAVVAAIAGLLSATVLAWVGTIAAFLGPIAATLIQIGTWLVAALLASFAIGAAYRLGPAHPPKGWQFLSRGAISATFLWLAATIGFGFYVSRFGNYNATYGSLSAVVVLLMWLWVSSYAILLGATINAVITPPKPRHPRQEPGEPSPA